MSLNVNQTVSFVSLSLTLKDLCAHMSAVMQQCVLLMHDVNRLVCKNMRQSLLPAALKAEKLAQPSFLFIPILDITTKCNM